MIVLPGTALEIVVSVTAKVMVTQERHGSKRSLYDVVDEADAEADHGTLYLRHDDRVWSPRELADAEPDEVEDYTDLLAETEQEDLYAELGL